MIEIKQLSLGSSPLTEHSRFQRDDHQTTQHINMHNLQEQRVEGEQFHDTSQLPMHDGAEVGLTEAFQSQQQPTNKYPPLDIRANMSQKEKANPRDAKMAHITYTVSSSRVKETASLVDRGANGGIAGQDVKDIATTDRTVDIQGIDNHQLCSCRNRGGSGAYQ
jgi:hypothetical protein